MGCRELPAERGGGHSHPDSHTSTTQQPVVNEQTLWAFGGRSPSPQGWLKRGHWPQVCLLPSPPGSATGWPGAVGLTFPSAPWGLVQWALFVGLGGSGHVLPPGLQRSSPLSFWVASQKGPFRDRAQSQSWHPFPETWTPRSYCQAVPRAAMSLASSYATVVSLPPPALLTLRPRVRILPL